MAICKACGVKIRFIKTKRGGCIPCEEALVEYWHAVNSKNKVVKPNGQVVAGVVFEKPEDALDGDLDPRYGGTGYIPHWGNCPGSDVYRKKR